jgi:hypothetical protein
MPKRMNWREQMRAAEGPKQPSLHCAGCELYRLILLVGGSAYSFALRYATETVTSGGVSGIPCVDADCGAMYPTAMVLACMVWGRTCMILGSCLHDFEAMLASEPAILW